MEEARPFAWGLEGPSSMCPLPDGRFLITEFWGGRIRDITQGGDARKSDLIAEGLQAPYSLVYDERRRKLSVTVSTGRSRADILIDLQTGQKEPLVKDIPLFPPPGFEDVSSPPDDSKRGRDMAVFAGCNDWKKVNRVPELPYGSLLTVAEYLLGVPDAGGPFAFGELLEHHCLASGLHFTGGMIDDPLNPEITYITQPLRGSVIAVNVKEHGDYRHQPPVVSGLPMVSCVRISPNGEKMFACSISGGVVWAIEGFSHM